MAQDECFANLALAADYRDDLTGLHAQRVGLLAAFWPKRSASRGKKFS